MPNGNLGGGSGSQENPYLVYDVYDLNALRGKPSESMIYIKFMADIDFSGTPYEGNFTSIRLSANTASATANDLITIDGNNKTIRNFKQIGSGDDYRGLFARVAGYQIVNLSLVNCCLGNSNGFAYFISADLIDNLKIDGVAPTNQTFHGLAYTVAGYSGVPVNIQNCIIALKITGSASTYNGYFFQTSSGKTANIYKCVSACNIYCTNSSGPSLGGFVGNVSANTVAFDSCISACKFVADNASQSFGSSSGIAGYHSSSNVSVSFVNCISKCEFIGKPPSTATRMSAFSANNGSYVSQCYSISQYNFFGATTTIQGGMGRAFFDYEVSGLPLSQFTDGTTHGCTTAQLKSRAFLESKGWTF